MAKKEFPEEIVARSKGSKGNKDNFDNKDSGGLGGDFSSKISGFSSKIFGVVKLILAIVILPFVYSTIIAFISEFNLIDKSLQQVFINGIITFLGIYLFIWEPALIYNKGHKLLEVMFSFVKPMVNVAPFLLPIYTILFFIIYGLLYFGIKSDRLIHVMLFLIGFSSILHLTFSAKTIRGKKGDFLKANYIFGFSFIFILNLGLLALGLSTIFKEYSFINYCNTSFVVARDIFRAVFNQLFVF